MNKYLNEYLNEAGINSIKAKTYSDTFLYSKGSYDKKIFEFIMHSDTISKDNPVLLDIKDDLKRTKSGAQMVKIIDSPNTILCIGNEALPRAFKVFVGKDVKGDKTTTKLFIDLTGILIPETGSKNTYKYKRFDLGIITSYLLAGMNTMIYTKDPAKLVNNSTLTDSGCKCFSSLIFFLIDYLRLCTDEAMKSKLIYYSSLYYQTNILNKPIAEGTINRSLRLAGISEQQAKLIDITLEGIKNPYENVKSFVEGLAAITKADNLTLDVFIDKWLYHIGVGTQFGLEYFPAFAQILIYAYVGAYLNHQKTIEKCIGKSMIEFVNKILAIGSELV